MRVMPACSPIQGLTPAVPGPQMLRRGVRTRWAIRQPPSARQRLRVGRSGRPRRAAPPASEDLHRRPTWIEPAGLVEPIGSQPREESAGVVTESRQSAGARLGLAGRRRRPGGSHQVRRAAVRAASTSGWEQAGGVVTERQVGCEVWCVER